MDYYINKTAHKFYLFSDYAMYNDFYGKNIFSSATVKVQGYSHNLLCKLNNEVPLVSLQFPS